MIGLNWPCVAEKIKCTKLLEVNYFHKIQKETTHHAGVGTDGPYLQITFSNEIEIEINLKLNFKLILKFKSNKKLKFTFKTKFVHKNSLALMGHHLGLILFNIFLCDMFLLLSR